MPADAPPARSPRSWTMLAVGLFLAWSLVEARVNPGRLFSAEAFRAVGRFLGQLVSPDLSPSFLTVVIVALLRTAAIALAGTALALLLALPLSILATPTLFRRGPGAAGQPAGVESSPWVVAHLGARALLRVLRAVPDLLWALLFVVAVGLGPTAGALAVAVSSAGVLGRVFADVFEDVEPGPVQVLAASGGSRLSLFLFAILPQALPGLAGYSLYALECAVRAASMLGFVGAGGVGQEIQMSMRLFEYRQVSTLLLAFLAVMTLGEAASRRLRRRFRKMQAGGGRLTPRSRALAAGTVGMVVLAAFWGTGFFEEAHRGLLGRIARFAGALVPPDLSPGFLQSLVLPVRQTLAVAGAGTLLGLLLGGVLALPATAWFSRVPSDAPGLPAAPVRWLRAGVHAGARAVLALLRAVPELLWVLFCIIAVGFGPLAGALALGLHTAGVLGRLWAEALEETPSGPAEVVEAGGGSAVSRLLWAAWPQARGLLVSHALLRWEFNLRVSTLVGFLGGGGLGLLLYNSIQLGFYDRVGTLVLLIFGLVTLSDALSDLLRQSFAGQTAGERKGAEVEAERLPASAGVVAPGA